MPCEKATHKCLVNDYIWQYPGFHTQGKNCGLYCTTEISEAIATGEIVNGLTP